MWTVKNFEEVVKMKKKDIIATGKSKAILNVLSIPTQMQNDVPPPEIASTHQVQKQSGSLVHLVDGRRAG